MKIVSKTLTNIHSNLIDNYLFIYFINESAFSFINSLHTDNNIKPIMRSRLLLMVWVMCSLFDSMFIVHLKYRLHSLFSRILFICTRNRCIILPIITNMLHRLLVMYKFYILHKM